MWMPCKFLYEVSELLKTNMTIYLSFIVDVIFIKHKNWLLVR